MPRLVDDAIVLRRWEYSETSQTVSVLTHQHGIIRGLAKGALRPNGSFGGGFEPMTRGQLAWIQKDDRELCTLTEWSLQDVYWPVRQNLQANRLAIYAVDLTQRLLTDRDPHPDVFEHLHVMLEGAGQVDCAYTQLTHFQCGLLQSVGWMPQMHCDATTGEPLPENAESLGFRVAAGGVVANPISGDHRVRPSTVHYLASLNQNQPDPPADQETPRRAAALLAVHIRDLLGEGSQATRLAFPNLPA
ncbi:MAG: DNA repair protein RecO [Phycisphaerales bacterium]|nr:DNA repair protein RecO [Phycisphaerales bacterium]